MPAHVFAVTHSHAEREVPSLLEELEKHNIQEIQLEHVHREGEYKGVEEGKDFEYWKKVCEELNARGIKIRSLEPSPAARAVRTLHQVVINALASGVHTKTQWDEYYTQISPKLEELPKSESNRVKVILENVNARFRRLPKRTPIAQQIREIESALAHSRSLAMDDHRSREEGHGAIMGHVHGEDLSVKRGAPITYVGAAKEAKNKLKKMGFTYEHRLRSYARNQKFMETIWHNAQHPSNPRQYRGERV